MTECGTKHGISRGSFTSLRRNHKLVNTTNGDLLHVLLKKPSMTCMHVCVQVWFKEHLKFIQCCRNLKCESYYGNFLPWIVTILISMDYIYYQSFISFSNFFFLQAIFLSKDIFF